MISHIAIMNINLGEQFAEARKKRGVSLREAADTTKIRKDYLEAFEGNRFELPLPEIYVRGFIRLYAKYLGLDVNQVMVDYKTLVFGKPNGRRDTKEVFGRMDLIDKEKLLALNKEAEVTEKTATPYSKPSSSHMEIPSDKALLWKIGIVVGSCITLIALVLFLINTIIHSKDSDSNRNQTASAIQSQENSVIYLIGLGDVQVCMRQEKDKVRLFAGIIHKGEKKELNRQGPVQISFSEGANLLIEKLDGSQIRPKNQGHGWIKVP
ncbi:MAG: hypothetical protein A2007_06315 [Verrucomicrobia bacterium GWC2_42_7]|nr:MAG: hypothetical protein A2007_06315 [Verrucomicrobia bacterium GWC2_42_7]